MSFNGLTGTVSYPPKVTVDSMLCNANTMGSPSTSYNSVTTATVAPSSSSALLNSNLSSATATSSSTAPDSYTQEDHGNILLSIRKNPRVFTPPPSLPSVDTVATAAASTASSPAPVQQISTSISGPNLYYGRTMEDWQNKVVENQYLTLGLRQSVYEEIDSPEGYVSARGSINAPTALPRKHGKAPAGPSLNYLIYKYLSLVPGHKMNSANLRAEIIKWAPEVMTPASIRSLSRSQCTNEKFFISEERKWTRLRRLGECHQKGSGPGSKKRKNDGEAAGDYPPPTKKQQTKKPAAQTPATTKPMKCGNGKKATSSNSLLDIFEIRDS